MKFQYDLLICVDTWLIAFSNLPPIAILANYRKCANANA
jgi:hypothetical protein